MRVLIRFITRNAAGTTEHNDKLIDAPVLTIGRATDQILQLKDRRARLQHAKVELRNGNAHIASTAIAGVTVNGRSQRDAALALGDVIEVGANVLCVIEASEAVDFAISFELSADASSEHLEPSWTTPTSGIGGFSKRRLSWGLAAIVLILAFAIPALTLVSPDIASILRGTGALPDDSLWLAGPVHSAHSSIAAQCDACHVQAFERVPDSACLECHDSVAHVGEDATPVLGERRCASCHLEHNEPAELVNRHQRLCADCHTTLPASSGLVPGGDFLDTHPDFRVSLTQSSADGEWLVSRLHIAEAMTADRSNLKFDHKVHLDTGGIITPDGTRVLECGECHQPEPGGARMQPISMDEHCIGCHTLNFDPDDPARVVPHGDPEGVLQELIEYYSARLLGEDPEARTQRLRRPGQTLTREDRDRAAVEARSKALEVAEDLFERQACANCHEVTKASDDVELPWVVLPVRLTNAFFPHANFTHAAHDTEVSRCDSCHKATESTSAHDLLMPDIESCRDCHGSGIAGRNNSSQLPSTCIMCHSFHFGSNGE